LPLTEGVGAGILRDAPATKQINKAKGTQPGWDGWEKLTTI
jgi:hypothetical protein